MHVYTQPRLEVNLNHVAENYHFLKKMASPSLVAAVVKNNAYGLGAAPVSERLYKEGCRHFFVAHATEGEKIRPFVPEAYIYVLQGVGKDSLPYFKKSNLTPVISMPQQLAFWEKHKIDGIKPIIQIETGLNRLGFRQEELKRLSHTQKKEFSYVMSHLACADDPSHFMNERQRHAFDSALAVLGNLPASLAASDGIFLGKSYHYSMVRVGAALYGLNPFHNTNALYGMSARSCASLDASQVDSLHEDICESTLPSSKTLECICKVGEDGMSARSRASLDAYQVDSLHEDICESTLPSSKTLECICKVGEDGMSARSRASLDASQVDSLHEDICESLHQTSYEVCGICPRQNEIHPMMKAVLFVKAPILQIEHLNIGDYIGYGATYKIQKSIKMAVVSIGYGDGLPRCLSNKGVLYFNGEKVPIIGRVSMDNIMCDVSDISNIQEGDFISVLDEVYTADDLAAVADTIGYEVLSNFGKGERFCKSYIG